MGAVSIVQSRWGRRAGCRRGQEGRDRDREARTAGSYAVEPKVTSAFSSIVTRFDFSVSLGSEVASRAPTGATCRSRTGPASMVALLAFRPRRSAASVSCSTVEPMPRAGKRSAHRAHFFTSEGAWAERF